MGKFYGHGSKRRVSKHSRKKHKKRAQKRKEAFGGLAAFCHTNPKGMERRPRLGRLG